MWLLKAPEGVTDLPVKELAAAGALVAVWVTNKESFHNFVKKTLFGRWGVSYVATWYWLKVTAEGTPVLPLTSTHRKPYEPVILGRFPPVSQALPQEKLLLSVPLSHSRKPPLNRLLAPHLPHHPRQLELFARNLTPHCTSWGNEPLRFNDTALFIHDQHST